MTGSDIWTIAVVVLCAFILFVVVIDEICLRSKKFQDFLERRYGPDDFPTDDDDDKI